MDQRVGRLRGRAFVGISFTAHRRSHLKHHRSTNHPDEDPDMPYSANTIAGLAAVWLKAVPKEWVFAASFEHFTDAEKVVMRREFAAIILSRLLILLLCADLGVDVNNAAAWAAHR